MPRARRGAADAGRGVCKQSNAAKGARFSFTHEPHPQTPFRPRRGRCAQVTPCRAGNAGLLTSGAVFAYTAMLLWGALSSEPVDGVCVLHSGTGNIGLRV